MVGYAEDEQFMLQALQLAAQAAKEGEVPVGAVVVKDNKIIGRGYNKPIGNHDPSAHAEIQALRDAAANLGNYRLPDTTLYVTVEPCSMCAGAIVHARVKTLVYGTLEPKSGVVDSQEEFFNSDFLNHQVEWRGGVLADEASRLMTAFFKGRR